jgi:hypothetical protein
MQFARTFTATRLNVFSCLRRRIHSVDGANQGRGKREEGSRSQTARDPGVHQAECSCQAKSSSLEPLDASLLKQARNIGVGRRRLIGCKQTRRLINGVSLRPCVRLGRGQTIESLLRQRQTPLGRPPAYHSEHGIILRCIRCTHTNRLSFSRGKREQARGNREETRANEVKNSEKQRQFYSLFPTPCFLFPILEKQLYR